LKLKTTWFEPFWLTLFSTAQDAFRSSAVCFFSSWYVKTTSAAVIGLPSDHFTPGRIVNVNVLLLLLHAYFDASHGVALPLWSRFW